MQCYATLALAWYSARLATSCIKTYSTTHGAHFYTIPVVALRAVTYNCYVDCVLWTEFSCCTVSCVLRLMEVFGIDAYRACITYQLICVAVVALTTILCVYTLNARFEKPYKHIHYSVLFFAHLVPLSVLLVFCWANHFRMTERLSWLPLITSCLSGIVFGMMSAANIMIHV